MSDTRQTRTFAIVAGEASGDILGAGLIRELKHRNPDARFVGIGGPLMMAEGFESLFPMDRLSVMGLVEVLGRLKELLGIRKSLRDGFIADPPSVFIGIDAPDFNLPLERKLRDAGVATVHYVSPSVWAWRQKRVLKIREAVDHMLCLLPFETEVYEKHGVPATFIGHSLADQIPMEEDSTPARNALGYTTHDRVVGVLPGSRGGEVKKLAPLFLEAVKLMLDAHPELKFVVPCANASRRSQIEGFLLARDDNLPVKLVGGQSHEVMAASDVLLMASGTAALEGLLHKKPMVISYRVNGLTYWIMRRLVTIDRFSLPNLLAGKNEDGSHKDIVPEIIQDDATPEALAEATLTWLDNADKSQALVEEYRRIHALLKQDASARAADTVMGVVEAKEASL
ncbi:lipid-A-disaccharide synthase [Sansalvadorimonas verongulae]|uniref:lipid-A-disaccharide synthase n=1 Tax=Sansalvadorimonas verongulae TaxID=2172824 RepID=UPI0012BBF46C|nr:lipid-A-disaccharide synthase [Sansalvadorimonas verongulae]MTI14256.1 lipid-A-disaccharide synthase [Sansalvadorimonas verongulae]